MKAPCGSSEQATPRRWYQRLESAERNQVRDHREFEPGSYIGTAAPPQPDGMQKALVVHVFLPPAGWPDSRAQAAFRTVTRPCSDAEHQATVREWAALVIKRHPKRAGPVQPVA
jgi:hypothetical protein